MSGTPSNGGGADSSPGWTERFRRSFQDSVGSIVFGMEDGTVSIFGLVFGVSASAPNSSAVLLAGATGAAAAAVSMMAGTYLDVESSNDKADADLAEKESEYADDPQGVQAEIHGRLVKAGFGDSEADTVIRIVSEHPDTGLKIRAGVDLGVGESTRQNPFVQSAWMFVTDLFAAFVPVVPFAFLALASARLVSLLVTLFLLVGLGVGRALIGHRRMVTTVAETIGIATAAAVVGVGVGKLIS